MSKSMNISVFTNETMTQNMNGQTLSEKYFHLLPHCLHLTTANLKDFLLESNYFSCRRFACPNICWILIFECQNVFYRDSNNQQMI